MKIKNEIISSVIDSATAAVLGGVLFFTTCATIVWVKEKLDGVKAQRELRQKYNRLIDLLQDRVDNHGFAEGLDEEYLQKLRDLGIKF